MIAMAIIGIIITAIYSSWSAIVRSTKTGETAADEVLHTRNALRALESAFGSVVMFSQNNTYYSFTVDTSGDYATVSMVSRLPSTFPGSGVFPEQPTRRVTFSVVPGDRGNQLVMSQTSLLIPPNSNDDPYTLVLVKNVSNFGVEFFDSTQNDWVYDWTQTNALPLAVRVSLGFNGSGNSKSTANITTISVALPAPAVAKQDQMPDVAPTGGNGNGTNKRPKPAPNPNAPNQPFSPFNPNFKPQ